MADQKPLKIASGEEAEFVAGDTVAIANGGTGATTAAAAATALGAVQGAQTGTLTTTDATPTNFFAPTTSTGTANLIDGFVIARNTSTGDTATWITRWTIKNTAGTGALVGSATITSIAADASLSTAVVAMNSARLRVTGIAATTIHWSFDGRQIVLT